MHKRAVNPIPEPDNCGTPRIAKASPAGAGRLASLADIEEQIRSAPSLWDTLSEEDREFFRRYKGPEVLGPPPPAPGKHGPRAQARP